MEIIKLDSALVIGPKKLFKPLSSFGVKAFGTNTEKTGLMTKLALALSEQPKSS